MRRVSFPRFMILTVFAGGCATAGYGVSVPGYETFSVVDANQALVYGLAAQAVQPLYAVPGFGQVPVCRLQDLRGLPPVNQPVVVRVPKSKGHRTADIAGGAVLGAGIGYLNSGGNNKVAAAGAGIGGAGGMIVANHEPADLCLFLPFPQAQPQQAIAVSAVHRPAPSNQSRSGWRFDLSTELTAPEPLAIKPLGLAKPTEPKIVPPPPPEPIPAIKSLPVPPEPPAIRLEILPIPEGFTRFEMAIPGILKIFDSRGRLVNQLLEKQLVDLPNGECKFVFVTLNGVQKERTPRMEKKDQNHFVVVGFEIR